MSSRPLHRYAADSAERFGDAVAVRLGAEALSYAELVSGARRLAALLRERGVEPGDRVALAVAKAPAAIVAMHAVLEAGAAYVPLDLASPPARAELVVRSAAPKLIVATETSAPLLGALADGGLLAGVPVLALDPPWGDPPERVELADASGWRGGSDDPSPIAGGSGSDLAHLLFTSGSTGTPKGVQVTHAMVGAFIDWARSHFGTRPGDRISCHPPLHFDLSTFDIYATLAAGAELHLVPAGANLLPGALADFIREGRLTQWFSVPSTFAFMLGAGVVGEGDFPSLERVLFCGEEMPAPVLAEWMRRVPQPTYTNLYGPTESAIASSYYDVPPGPDGPPAPVPIGTPCDGERIEVLDPVLQPRPPGEVGEIYISGAGLSPGYWRDPAKTAAAFVVRPDDGERLYRTGDLGRLERDGTLNFLGRVDSQIKHRGHRIELGEIEAALAGLGTLRESAVVAVVTDGFEGNRICCAFAPREPTTDGAAVRAALRSRLPGYMLPSEWESVEALPKNASGKIDRRRLAEDFEARLGTADESLSPGAGPSTIPPRAG